MTEYKKESFRHQIEAVGIRKDNYNICPKLAFKQMDYKSSGSLDSYQLQGFLIHRGVQCTQSQCKHLINLYKQTNQLTYDIFLTHQFNKQKILQIEQNQQYGGYNYYDWHYWSQKEQLSLNKVLKVYKKQLQNYRQLDKSKRLLGVQMQLDYRFLLKMFQFKQYITPQMYMCIIGLYRSLDCFTCILILRRYRGLLGGLLRMIISIGLKCSCWRGSFFIRGLHWLEFTGQQSSKKYKNKITGPKRTKNYPKQTNQT